MNKLLSLIVMACVAAFALHVSCNKDVDGRTADLPPLAPSKTDIDAGAWTPVLLTGPTEFAVAAPIATNAPDYIAQINEIKAWQNDLTDDEKDLVKYWAAGAVLRWNEILRELVAKRNLPPYQNPDGTYPAPQANNPLAYPFFPFANPPYSARAYAYVAAAQYDALVAAFHYKKQYNRKAPYNVDSSLQVLVTKSDLPSYPSEDAVVAAVACEVLKLMFPGDQEFIQKKAEEHMRARILAGANVRSDIEAGEALGKAVAQKFVARARTDRAGQAGGTPAEWKKLADDCIAKGEEPWISLETPLRPPMLPKFGVVRAFLFDSLTAISLRPPPPPLTASPKMKDETDEILKLIENDTRENYRIVHFWADGAGTSSPPGHWDQIATEDFVKKNWSEVRWARNLALLNMVLMDAAITCWDAKMFYFNPRPSQLNSKIKTLTGVPNFPAYVSGHSTFSGGAAAILGHIIPERAAAYEAMAQEASRSRMLAGIHYRADCEEGLALGKRVAAFAITRAQNDGAGN
jgi:hypothetical protein